MNYTIRMAARRSGLSAHVIRIWEQRYGAVEPGRTETKRRMYSEADIERLRLLRAATRAGHSIGTVARLPLEKLRELAVENEPGVRESSWGPEPDDATTFLQEGLAAVKRLDTTGLEETLKRGMTKLGAMGLLNRVIAPLARGIGDLWRDGTLTAAHEHFASALIRAFLTNAARPFGAMENAPVLLAGTPAGQVHELGALLAGAAAANLGWRVIYLGASLPAAEIAGAARLSGAQAVALSLVYPEDDPELAGELTRLRQLMPKETALVAGGRAAATYREVLEPLGVIMTADLREFGEALDALRKRGGKVKVKLRPEKKPDLSVRLAN